MKYPWNKKWIMFSPFMRGQDSVTNALKLAKQKEKEYLQGKNIGFSYVSSLKSMGRIPRSTGEYVLGEKYRNI